MLSGLRYNYEFDRLFGAKGDRRSCASKCGRHDLMQHFVLHVYCLCVLDLFVFLS